MCILGFYPRPAHEARSRHAGGLHSAIVCAIFARPLATTAPGSCGRARREFVRGIAHLLNRPYCVLRYCGATLEEKAGVGGLSIMLSRRVVLIGVVRLRAAPAVET